MDGCRRLLLAPGAPGTALRLQTLTHSLRNSLHAVYAERLHEVVVSALRRGRYRARRRAVPGHQNDLRCGLFFSETTEHLKAIRIAEQHVAEDQRPFAFTQHFKSLLSRVSLSDLPAVLA